MAGAGFKGAEAELTAVVHLMRQGYYVYRCESPAAPFDLAAYRDGELLRVEVKSLNWSPTTRARGFGPTITWPTNDEWDLLVVVDRDEGLCHEFTTRDRSVAVDELRVSYGFPPATRPSRLEVLLDEPQRTM